MKPASSFNRRNWAQDNARPKRPRAQCAEPGCEQTPRNGPRCPAHHRLERSLTATLNRLRKAPAHR
jgi:hypothetical protein